MCALHDAEDVQSRPLLDVTEHQRCFTGFLDGRQLVGQFLPGCGLLQTEVSELGLRVVDPH